jgi:DNA polymerase-4
VTTDGRTILHVDMDAFYVSVELLRRPELRGRPVVVGGTGERGVVAAASYEARRFGISSAMASARARRLCPDAVFLPGDHAHYAQVSRQVHEVFASVTPTVEPIALDEAFLDVTGARRRLGDGVTIGTQLRRSVLDATGLVCSVGVAGSKFLAKLASEAAKPRATPGGIRPGAGVVEVPPGAELAFLHPQPVGVLWGVGPKTLERLERLGITTVGDVAAASESALVASLGASAGRHLYALARGIDDRPVVPDRAAKSIGHEQTFATDLSEPEALDTELVRMVDAVAARLRAHERAGRTVTVKVRFASFETVTRSVTAAQAESSAPALLALARPLLAKIDIGRGVRLLGVAVSHLGERPARQLRFDDVLAGSPTGSDGAAAPAPSPVAWEEASSAVDAVRRRFGAAAIGPARLLADGGVRASRPGDAPWGPDDERVGRPGPADRSR